MASRLLGARDVRQLAAHIGLRPTKTLGQNFVHDANTVRRIVALADVPADAHVIEIGPGLGSLTLGLLSAAAHVTAVEIDPRLAEQLPQTAGEFAVGAADKLTVITADALQIVPTDLPAPPTALVANLPYNVGVPILLRLLRGWPTITTALVMVQAEVADRLAAGPGNKIYGIPSAKLGYLGTATRAATIPRGVFWPVPNVDSALVSWQRTATPPAEELAEVFTVIDAAFAQRRKTLRAGLASWAGSPAAAERACQAAGISPQARAETLPPSAFAALAAARPHGQ